MRKVNKPLCRAGQSGFSFIEILIVLIVIGIVGAAGVSSWSAYLNNSYQNLTMSNLEQTKRAMLDYVMVNYHMPCPDTDNDGNENRDADGKACYSVTGTVPYNDIGRSKAQASDAFLNVFAYGVTLDASTLSQMQVLSGSGDSEERYGAIEPSYFANQAVVSELSNLHSVDAYKMQLPLFGLETAPTNLVAGTSGKNFVVCKTSATSCPDGVENLSPASMDIEVKDIPAVIVAFNENGQSSTLATCNGSAMSAQELENCDADRYLLRQTFKDGGYDDQIVTISAYEIKQQVLSRLSSLTLDGDFKFNGYEYIVNKDLTSTNDFNSETNDAGVDVNGNGSFEDEGDVYGDSLYVTGNVEANINLQNGSNKLKVDGNVSAVINGGSDVDVFIIGGSIDSQGRIELEDGVDNLSIGGDVTGEISAAGGDDVITIEKSVFGSIDMGRGNDVLTVNGDLHANVYGGEEPSAQPFTDGDVIKVNKSQVDFIASGQLSFVKEFTYIEFSDNPGNLVNLQTFP